MPFPINPLAFFVFLRLPGGRKQTQQYVAELQVQATTPKAPGAYFALVRQMQLIDDRGRIIVTPVVETLQIRGQKAHEYKLSRKEFFWPESQASRRWGRRTARDYLAFLGRNIGAGRTKVMATCSN